ncbi:hypothetical protein L9F63_007232, partial [Diploptera punctata]
YKNQIVLEHFFELLAWAIYKFIKSQSRLSDENCEWSNCYHHGKTFQKLGCSFSRDANHAIFRSETLFLYH